MKHQNYIEHQIEILDKLILLEKQNAVLLEALKSVRDWYHRDEPRLAIVIEKVEQALAKVEGE